MSNQSIGNRRRRAKTGELYQRRTKLVRRADIYAHKGEIDDRLLSTGRNVSRSPEYGVRSAEYGVRSST